MRGEAARRDGRRRLRPSPDRDRRGHRRRARRHRPPRRRRLPAASLYADARAARASSAPRSAAADEVVLTDIYAGRRGADSGRHRRSAGRRRRRGSRPPGARRARRSTTCRPPVATLARPSDLVDHARRRIDRHARRSHSRARFAAPAPHRRPRHERQGAGREELPPREGEAGAAQEQARRADVSVARRALGAGDRRSSATRRIGRSTSCCSASALQVRHITVHGNVRLSSGEVQALVDGLRGHEHPDRRSRRATGGGCSSRRGSPTSRCGACCRRRSKCSSPSARRWGCAGSAAQLYLIDRARHGDRRVRPAVRGVRPADHRRPRARAVVGRSRRIDERARRAGRAGHRGARAAARISRSACRRSTCTTRTTPSCCSQATRRCCTSARTGSSSGCSRTWMSPRAARARAGHRLRGSAVRRAGVRAAGVGEDAIDPPCIDGGTATTSPVERGSHVARKERYLVGLDVGTSKIAAIVGEMTDDGGLDIIGIGLADSQRHPARRRRQPRGGGRIDQEGDRRSRADGRRRDRLRAPRPVGRARQGVQQPRRGRGRRQEPRDHPRGRAARDRRGQGGGAAERPRDPARAAAGLRRRRAGRHRRAGRA